VNASCYLDRPDHPARRGTAALLGLINSDRSKFVRNFDSSLAALSTAVGQGTATVQAALQQLANDTGATAAAFTLTALQTDYNMPSTEAAEQYTLILALCNKRQYCMQIPAGEPQWSTDAVKAVFPFSLVLNANTSECIHDSDGRCVHISSDNEQWLRLLSAMYNFAEIELLRAARVLFDTTLVSFVGGLSWQSLLAELDSVVGQLALPLARQLLSSSSNVNLAHPSPLQPTLSRHPRISSLCYQQWCAAVPEAAELTVSEFNAAMQRKGHTCTLSDSVGDAVWPGRNPDAADAQEALDEFYNAVSRIAHMSRAELQRQLTAPVAPAELYAADAAAAAHRLQAVKQLSEALPGRALSSNMPPALGRSGVLVLDSWAPCDDVKHAHRRAPVGKTQPVMSLSGAITATVASFMSTPVPSGKVRYTHPIVTRLRFLQCE
jgi:hypothetical protein